ncbi:MAG: hypothetical protein BEN18_03630 [Epulopiscium sp. Nuni2H_MBin001]|nr:MAG: hypothetical protein BEN18_03630 [Epulopiscium sp. Nuni2H_MBin001]
MKKLLAGVLAATTILSYGTVFATETRPEGGERPEFTAGEGRGHRGAPSEEALAQKAEELGITIDELLELMETERPQDGERPELPDGERPQRPERPEDGERPELPDGERPERLEDGERPELPDGERPEGHRAGHRPSEEDVALKAEELGITVEEFIELGKSDRQ